MRWCCASGAKKSIDKVCIALNMFSESIVLLHLLVESKWELKQSLLRFCSHPKHVDWRSFKYDIEVM